MKALAEAKNEGQLVRATEQLTEVFNNVETLIPEKHVLEMNRSILYGVRILSLYLHSMLRMQ